MDDAYLQLVSDVPIPTPEQTAAFAEHVAGAHSWYKHLPLLPPGGRFRVFLDPNAGRALVHTASGETAYVDLVERDDLFHYSSRLTAEYRERFGAWVYHADHSPGIFLGSARGGWRSVDAAPRVLGPGGEWIAVPDDLADAGTCGLTAFVHDLPPRWITTDRHPGQVAAFRHFAAARPDDDAVARYGPILDAVVRDDAARFVEFAEAERPRQRAVLRAALHTFRERIAARLAHA